MTNLYKPFEDKFKQFGFEYNRAEDLYDAMRTIHRLVGSRDYGNIKTMDQDVLGSALIDIASAFGTLEGRGTSHTFTKDGKRYCIK